MLENKKLPEKNEESGTEEVEQSWGTLSGERIFEPMTPLTPTLGILEPPENQPLTPHMLSIYDSPWDEPGYGVDSKLLAQNSASQISHEPAATLGDSKLPCSQDSSLDSAPFPIDLLSAPSSPLPDSEQPLTRSMPATAVPTSLPLQSEAILSSPAYSASLASSTFIPNTNRHDTTYPTWDPRLFRRPTSLQPAYPINFYATPFIPNPLYFPSLSAPFITRSPFARISPPAPTSAYLFPEAYQPSPSRRDIDTSPNYFDLSQDPFNELESAQIESYYNTPSHTVLAPSDSYGRIENKNKRKLEQAHSSYAASYSSHLPYPPKTSSMPPPKSVIPSQPPMPTTAYTFDIPREKKIKTPIKLKAGVEKLLALWRVDPPQDLVQAYISLLNNAGLSIDDSFDSPKSLQDKIKSHLNLEAFKKLNDTDAKILRINLNAYRKYLRDDKLREEIVKYLHFDRKSKPPAKDDKSKTDIDLKPLSLEEALKHFVDDNIPKNLTRAFSIIFNVLPKKQQTLQEWNDNFKSVTLQDFQNVNLKECLSALNSHFDKYKAYISEFERAEIEQYLAINMDQIWNNINKHGREKAQNWNKQKQTHDSYNARYSGLFSYQAKGLSSQLQATKQKFNIKDGFIKLLKKKFNGQYSVNLLGILTSLFNHELSRQEPKFSGEFDSIENFSKKFSACLTLDFFKIASDPQARILKNFFPIYKDYFLNPDIENSVMEYLEKRLYPTSESSVPKVNENASFAL